MVKGAMLPWGPECLQVHVQVASGGEPRYAQSFFKHFLRATTYLPYIYTVGLCIPGHLACMGAAYILYFRAGRDMMNLDR